METNRQTKPLIGVIPLWDSSRNSIWMLPNYLDLITQSGGLPFILPLKAEANDILRLCELCDGVLFTGGDDVNPALYGETRGELCGVPCDERDRMERTIFDYSLQHNLPILGICRGIQIINTLCGGSLYQDLPSEYHSPSGTNHQMTPPYDRVCHQVRVVEESPLFEIIGGLSSLGVNSYHHQAIKSLAPKLRPMAISEDGLIEGVYMPDHPFLFAIQWHPELNYNVEPSSRAIVRRFIEVCEGR